jgi:hypothetical protein
MQALHFRRIVTARDANQTEYRLGEYVGQNDVTTMLTSRFREFADGAKRYQLENGEIAVINKWDRDGSLIVEETGLKLWLV